LAFEHNEVVNNGNGFKRQSLTLDGIEIVDVVVKPIEIGCNKYPGKFAHKVFPRAGPWFISLLNGIPPYWDNVYSLP
jgi:hypothetical protein